MRNRSRRSLSPLEERSEKIGRTSTTRPPTCSSKWSRDLCVKGKRKRTSCNRKDAPAIGSSNQGQTLTAEVGKRAKAADPGTKGVSALKDSSVMSFTQADPDIR